MHQGEQSCGGPGREREREREYNKTGISRGFGWGVFPVRFALVLKMDG